jgi:hypothetical protein
MRLAKNLRRQRETQIPFGNYKQLGDGRFDAESQSLRRKCRRRRPMGRSKA